MLMLTREVWIRVLTEGQRPAAGTGQPDGGRAGRVGREICGGSLKMLGDREVIECKVLERLGCKTLLDRRAQLRRPVGRCRHRRLPQPSRHPTVVGRVDQ